MYDVENTWDRVGWPADRFYSDAVAAVGPVPGTGSVLDVGCGTRAMLRRASEEGHAGRLVSVNPDEARRCWPARGAGATSSGSWAPPSRWPTTASSIWP